MTLPRAVLEPADRALPPSDFPTPEPPTGLGVASRSWLPSLGSPDISLQYPHLISAPRHYGCHRLCSISYLLWENSDNICQVSTVGPTVAISQSLITRSSEQPQQEGAVTPAVWKKKRL